MSLHRVFRAIFILLISLSIGSASFAQTPSDANETRALIERAQEALERGGASDEAFQELRQSLNDARAAAREAADLVPSEILTIDAQLAEIGPPPEDPATEEQNTKALREALQAERDAAYAPNLAARKTAAELQVLIDQIDILLRQRQTAVLFTLGASPISGSAWSAALSGSQNYFGAINREVFEALNAPASRAQIMDRLPITLFMICIGLVMFFQRFLTFSELDLRSLRKFWHAVIIRFGLPIAGLYIFSFALIGSGLFAQNTTPLFAALPLGIALILVAEALQSAFRPVLFDGNIEEDETPTGAIKKDDLLFRLSVIGLGVGLGLSEIVNVIAGTAQLEQDATALLRLPFILLISISLFTLQALFSSARPAARSFSKVNVFSQRLLLAGRVALAVIGIVAPFLTIIGYTEAGFQIIRSSGLSVATVFLWFGLYLSFSNFGYKLERRISEVDDEGRTAALFRFFLSIGLICVAVPLLVLIWGGTRTDLIDFWTRVEKGVSFGGTQLTLNDFVRFIFIFGLGYVATRAFQATLRSNVLPNTRLDRGAQYAIVAGSGYLGIFFAALIAISMTGIDLSNLAIVAGALSVGIGFGLQNIVSNFISGIILLIERPFKEGDWIEVQGVHGTVKHISVRSTEIQAFDRSAVIVPNADLVSGRMTNYTHRSLVGRVRASVGVAYGSDIDRVSEILIKIAKDHPMVLLNPEPSVVFMGFGESALDFEIRAIVRDVNWVLSVKSDMHSAIYKAFMEEGIEIPFAKRDITITSAEGLRVTKE